MTFDPQVELVLAYWQRLRGGRAAPKRAELDPARLTPVAPRTLLAERIAPGNGRIRVAGQVFDDLMGMEVRGMPLSAFIVPQDRATFAQALERTFEGGVDTRLLLLSRAGDGDGDDAANRAGIGAQRAAQPADDIDRAHAACNLTGAARVPDLGAQMLLLPLVNGRNGAAAVLGCLTLPGPALQAPRRFRLLSVTHRTVPPLRPAASQPSRAGLAAAAWRRPGAFHAAGRGLH